MQPQFETKLTEQINQWRQQGVPPEEIRNRAKVIFDAYQQQFGGATEVSATTPTLNPEERIQQAAGASSLPLTGSISNVARARNEDPVLSAARLQEEQRPVFPVGPSDSLPMMGLKAAGNLLPTGLKNLAVGLAHITNPMNWGQIAYSIWKDPTMLGGPAVSEAFSTAGAVGTNLLQGKPKEAVKELGEGAHNVTAAMANDPLTAWIGLRAGKGTVRAITNPAKTAATFGEKVQGAGKIISKVADEGLGSTIKGAVIDPFAARLEKFWDAGRSFFKGSRSQLEKVARLKQFEAQEIIQNLNQIDDLMNRVPKYSDEYNALVQQRAQLQTELSRNTAGARRQADLIVRERQGELVGEGNTSQALRQAQEFWAKTKEDAINIYNTNLVAPDGSPIPVSVGPVIESFNPVIETAKKVARPDDYQALLDTRGNLLLRDLWQRYGSWEAASDALGNIKNLLSDEQQKQIFKTNRKGETTINEGALRFYEAPVDAKTVASIIKSFEERISDPGLLSEFGKNVDGTFKKVRNETLAQVDPERLANVEYADQLWNDMRSTKIPATPAEAFKNWDNFVRQQPPAVVEQFRNYQAADILRRSFNTKGELNPVKLQSEIELHRNILGDGLYNELKSLSGLYDYESLLRKAAGERTPAESAIVNAEQLQTRYQESLANIDARIKQTLRDERTTADESVISKQIDRIDTVDKLNELARQTGLDPYDIGDWAIQKAWERAKTDVGLEGKAFDLTQADRFIAEVNKIGGKAGQTSRVQGQVFRPEAIKAINLLREVSDLYKTAQSVEAQGVLRRISMVGLGGLITFGGFSRLIGAKYMIQGLLPDQPVAPINGREIGILKKEAPGFWKTYGMDLAKLGFIGEIPSLADYIQSAESVMGPLSPNQQKQLEKQYEMNIAPGL